MASPDGVTVLEAAHPSAADGSSRRAEVEGKAEAVRRAARELGFDRALLTTRRNFAWLTAGGDNHVIDTMEESVAAIFDAFTAATVPGRALSDVFAAGALAYEELGFGGEWQLHHQGGTIGYRPREVLATRAASETIVSVGMAFAWNPSVTGAKAEDTFIVTAAGPWIVTRDPAWLRDPDGHPAILQGEDRPAASSPDSSQAPRKEP